MTACSTIALKLNKSLFFCFPISIHNSFGWNCSHCYFLSWFPLIRIFLPWNSRIPDIQSADLPTITSPKWITKSFPASAKRYTFTILSWKFSGLTLSLVANFLWPKWVSVIICVFMVSHLNFIHLTIILGTTIILPGSSVLFPTGISSNQYHAENRNCPHHVPRNGWYVRSLHYLFFWGYLKNRNHQPQKLSGDENIVYL